ncbi:MAG: GerMN domain-containing protein [Defluviitaleaceae bacterium]|nr:GerMN domain-containing protein [Defluviitaleaceae bacterium]
MTTNKKIILIFSAAGIIFFLAILFFLFREKFDERHGTEFYFYNAAQGILETELRDYTASPDEALFQLFNGPKKKNLARVFPNVEMKEFLTDFFVEDGIVIAEFSHLYDEMPPVEEILFRSALTLTMSGLPNINGVIFRTASAEWFESADTIANNPSISSTRRTSEFFTLFFVDESGEGLITEEYFVADVQTHRRTQDLLETLIERQNTTGGVFALIPSETKIRRVINDRDRNSPGIYVDFSPEFNNFRGTTAQARMMLQSIAHTVLEHNDQTRVFFLIDSERRDEFHGVTDFNLGFTMDETMMLGYAEPSEEN